MIAFLTGRVSAKAASYALLDVGGVGYKLAMTTGSLAALPAEGDEVTVWTHLYVREDELSLFGFENEAEKESFEQLITVSGVGPKVALATLSALSPDALAAAIASGDDATIATVPGIGKKTAQRIILDLKDKLGLQGLGSGGLTKSLGSSAAFSEATDALLSMGFSSPEISAALREFDGGSSDAQALLKHALRRLGGGS
jgi:Holliday junction DNA helicase RuvA